MSPLPVTGYGPPRHSGIGRLASATSTPDAGLWSPGAFHPNLAAQPATCIDCHAVTRPTGLTRSDTTHEGDRQGMRHTVPEVFGRDCAFCHGADAKASGSAWSTSTLFHDKGIAPASCQGTIFE